jgi:hypothetical protein
MDESRRLEAGRRLSRLLWDELEVGMRPQRAHLLRGGKISQAMDYSPNASKTLTL